MAWYGDIRNRAPRGMHFEPVMLQEILAYEHFLAKVGLEMTAFDWDMIFRLDAIWTDSVPKDSEAERRRSDKTKPIRH